jgi:CRISPR-associated protein Csx17
LDAVDETSNELSLAVCLAAGGVRHYLSAARRFGKTYGWGDEDGNRVWSDRPLVDNLIAIARRREATGSWPALDAGVCARPLDVAAFLAGDVDDERLDALVWGLCSLACERSTDVQSEEGHALPAVFAITRLALTPHPIAGVELPHTPGVLARLAAGDAVAATRAAERRLRGAGLVARCGPISTTGYLARRAAAAQVFPLDSSTIAAMRRQIIRTTSLENIHHGPHRP